jgi:hypothetical protein
MAPQSDGSRKNLGWNRVGRIFARALRNEVPHVGHQNVAAEPSDQPLLVRCNKSLNSLPLPEGC